MARDIRRYFNGLTDHLHFVRRNRNSVDAEGTRKLRDNRIGVSFAEPAAAIIAEIIVDIAPVGNEAVLNQNAGDACFTSTTNNGKLIADFHLEYTTIGQSHRRQIVHYFLSKLDRCLRVVVTIGGWSIHFCAMRAASARVNMEAHKSLSALIDTALNAIQKIVAAVVSVLLARKNDIESVGLEPRLTRRNNLPGKVRLAFSVALRTRVNAAMAGIERNSSYAHRSSAICSGSRTGTCSSKSLLDSVRLLCVAITVGVIYASRDIVLVGHGSIRINIEAIAVLQQINYVFGIAALKAIRNFRKVVARLTKVGSEYKCGRIAAHRSRLHAQGRAGSRFVFQNRRFDCIGVIDGCECNSLIISRSDLGICDIEILERLRNKRV